MNEISDVPIESHLHCSFSHDVLKTWQGDCIEIRPSNLLYPLFVVPEDGTKFEIKSLPGVYRWGVDRLKEALDEAVANGLQSVLLFGVVSGNKDSVGSFASSEENPVIRACKLIRENYPQLLIVVDVCLCGYTTHGHCGIFDDKGELDNKASVEQLAAVAVAYAKAGAHVIAPSDMMDGRIGAIKRALHANNMPRVSVLSYAAKFASSFYGPFRDAADSHMEFGDRSFYQLPPSSRKLAMRAVKRDVKEGADMVMVKPGMPYLDVVRDTANLVDLPVAVYQVSGEYAMLYHSAAAGAMDLKKGVMESLIAFRRAGASIIISYFTPQVLKWIKEE